MFTQDRRFLSLTTPLGKDVPLLNGFTMSDRVSGLYTIELDALHTGMLDPKALLGQPVTISMGLREGQSRKLHGIVNEITIGGESERFRHYRLVVVPTLWLQTLTTDFKVFEKMSIPDIVQKMLKAAGIVHRVSLSGQYTEFDHCVQFRETNFHFISRLLQQAGIFYYFEHSQRQCTMVLADAPSAFQICPDQDEAPYFPEVGNAGLDQVATWDSVHSLRSGGYTLFDFHFERSNSVYELKEETVNEVAGNKQYKVADYPGAFTYQFNRNDSGSGSYAEGEAQTRLRMEELETENPLYTAQSYIRAFSAGHRFALRADTNAGEYVITSIQHTAMQFPPYTSGMVSDLTYSNRFTCIPFGDKFRPQREHSKPVARGPQTAIVTDGPDKYSRVKVKFHWGNDLQTAWVRVAQRWAGPNWGTIFIPRVGHEVIIDFIDGDPDQPIIVGSMYNAQNMPPYELPTNATQSGIKTRSMDGGGGQGGTADFNELRFEDKTGNEDIYFHAQKDFHRYVEHDDDLKVLNDQTITVTKNRTEVVEEGNEKVTVKQGAREIYVDTGNDKHQVKTGNREAIIDMGNDTLTVKMGNHVRKIDLGKSETEAMQSIELKVGANSIKIDQSGITMKGIMVKIEGTAMLETKAPMAQHKADAMMIVKGGITMIN